VTNRFALFMLVLVFSVQLFIQPHPAAAQNAAIKCGDIIKGELTKEKQVQTYPIILSPGDKATFAGQADGTSELLFGLTLDSSSAGFRIFPHRNARIDMIASPFLTTGRAPAYGLYMLYVQNRDKTGSYQISIGCELADGTIVAAGDTSYTPKTTGRPKTVTLPLAVIQGNSLKQLQCGDVVATEFTQNDQIHSYILEMAAGDVSFQVSISPFGDGLSIAAEVFEPSGKSIGGSSARGDNYQYAIPSPQLNVSPVSPGNYRIVVSNTAVYRGKVASPGRQDYMGGVGIYSLAVSCTLKGNKVVAPDLSKLQQAAAEEPAAQSSASSSVATANSPLAFDPAKAIRIPLIANTPMTGATTPTGSEAYGFTFDGKTGQNVDLKFTRLTGNLNLGMVVLSADNKVVFQASLVTSSDLTTTIPLPADGQYTIGVFKVDLLPPAEPQPTAFQVSAKVG
jgi:hypothetical protein